MTTDDYNRDFEDTNNLRFPGRFDPRLLQVTDDAGDGYPGLQTAIRNWLRDQIPELRNTYYVSTEAELNSALTSIDTNHGKIIVDDSISLTSTVEINGGGSYIISAYGKDISIDCGGNRRMFNITSAKSCKFTDLVLDGTDRTSGDIVHFAEVINNPCIVDNVTFKINSSLVKNILIESDYIQLINSTFDSQYGNTYINIDGGSNCRIINNVFGVGPSSTQLGVSVDSVNSKYNIISGNIFYSQNSIAVLIEGLYNTIYGNVIYECENGVSVYPDGDYNVITGNMIYDSAVRGIRINSGATNNTVVGNTALNSGTANFQDLGTDTFGDNTLNNFA